jgi:hypothetical protein
MQLRGICDVDLLADKLVPRVTIACLPKPLGSPSVIIATHNTNTNTSIPKSHFSYKSNIYCGSVLEDINLIGAAKYVVLRCS